MAQKYQPPQKLRKALEPLRNKKFKLDCGHHVTFHQFFGNSVIIINGKNLKVICTLCGY